MTGDQPNTDNNVVLHIEVMTGVIQTILFLDRMFKEGNRVSMGDLMRVGFEGKSDDAQTFICEWVKDGIVSLTRQGRESIIQGDYSSLWRSTNRYLARFGHPPIEPVPIEVKAP